MVKAFKFARLPQIIFKNGSLEETPEIIRRYGMPIILVTGKNSFVKSSKGTKFFDLLSRKNIQFHHTGIHSEPSPGDIDRITEKFRYESIALVVAIGGGSVLDAGKAISAMLSVTGSVKDYLEGVGEKEHPGKKVPFIAIPTTAGTGSEATKNAVISEVGPQGYKKSLRHDNFVPDLAILDPELALDCPPHITASSGMDCFTQLTEAYLSKSASPYTDAFAWEGLKAIKYSLQNAVKDGKDLEARAGMSYAALNSGVCLANAGLGTVHGFASVIGGRFEIPHGLVCGTLMPAANEVNLKELRKMNSEGEALKKYSALGKLFLAENFQNEQDAGEAFVDFLYRMRSELQLPGLAAYGIREDDLPLIASKTGNKNNPVDLDSDKLVEILKKSLK
jgi:alcohol dehydrogenase class IV